MPAQSQKLQDLREGAADGQLPYVSKSRVKKYITCPEKFFFSYIRGLKSPETGPMRRGTNIHETFEDYYQNVHEHVHQTGAFPDDLVAFLPDTARWADYLEPYITNFLWFEMQRMQRTEDPEAWLPVAIEAEAWLDDPLDYGEKAIPWMGYADAIYRASNFPEVDADEGVVIVDFKTGSTPSKKYRDEGIYLEGEYYAMLFESEWDVAAVAGYYPRNDDLIISPLKESRRDQIRDVVHEFQSFNEERPDHLEKDEQPLCKWGEGDDEECPYYNMCGSTWGEGLKHSERFTAMVERGDSLGEIAEDLGMSYGAAKYTKKKLNL